MLTRTTPLHGCLLVAACAFPLWLCADSSSPAEYDARYHAELIPQEGIAEAEIRITQGAGELWSINLAAPASRYHDFHGDGQISRKGDRLLWSVPKKGGVLSYTARVDSQRKGHYDARMTDHWAMFRLGDLFPPARVFSENDALSRASLSIRGPSGWHIETPFGSMSRTRKFNNNERRFDRPTGWAIAGELAIRRDAIADRRVTIASPLKQGVRRQDLLAFLHWTLPDLVEVFPSLPKRVLIVSAGDPMWRGGLSGPGSFYLHAQRPLISEDSTSPPLHELIHVATSTPPADGDDWIVEGLAEYYSLELLRRSGGISQQRFDQAIENMRARGKREGGRLADPSAGIDSVHALVLFHDLAAELQRAGASLDRITATLIDQQTIDRRALATAVSDDLGGASTVLNPALAELEKQ